MSRPTTSTKSTKANAWSRPLPRAPPGLTKTNNNHNNHNNNDKTSSSSSSSTTTTNALRYRFLQLQLSMIGQTVTLTLKNKSIIQGILHTFTPFDFNNNNNNSKKMSLLSSYQNYYVVKAVKVIEKHNDNDDDDNDIDLTNANGSTLIISSDKVCKLYVKSLRLEGERSNANNNNNNNEEHDPFRTDTDISSGGHVRKNNDLVYAGNEWTSAGDKKVTNNGSLNGALEDLSLEGSGSTSRGGLFRSSSNSGNTNNNNDKNNNNIGSWDQFSANEQKFGIKATYDENLYTTSLDKSAIDGKKQKEAERLAKEIESQSTSNIHLAEERGHVIQGDFDEEDLYSGVMVTKGNGAAIKERKQLILQPRTVGTSDSTKKMNYAAAAAASNKTTENASVSDGTVESTSPVVAANVNETEKTTEKSKKGEEKETSNEKKEEAKDTTNDEKPKSKLNPNAAKFVFNPSAAEWKPSFGGGGASTNTSTAPQTNASDNDNMSGPQQPMGGMPMQPQFNMNYQQHMQYQPMMYNPYQRVGVPQYGMMPMHGAPQQMQYDSSGNVNDSNNNDNEMTDSNDNAENDGDGGDGNNKTENENEESEEKLQGQGANIASHQGVPQHVPMGFNGPGGYYQNGMPMSNGPYPPQMVGGPRQIPVSFVGKFFMLT